MKRSLRRWLTLLAIVGTLCACGRYGPPTRRPREAPATSVPGEPTQTPAPSPSEPPSVPNETEDETATRPAR